MNAPATETALQKERRLFRELSARLRDAVLNRMFDLRPEKAVRRSSYLLPLFLLSGFIISLIYYPLPEWTSRIGDVFNALLRTTSTRRNLRAPSTN